MPHTLESQALGRLSPRTKRWPVGTGPHEPSGGSGPGFRYGSRRGAPSTKTLASRSLTVSPGSPITRMTYLPPEPQCSSVIFGDSNTTMSPRSIGRTSRTRISSLSSARHPADGRAQCSVGSIELETMRKVRSSRVHPAVTRAAVSRRRRARDRTHLPSPSACVCLSPFHGEGSDLTEPEKPRLPGLSASRSISQRRAMTMTDHKTSASSCSSAAERSRC